MGNFPQCLFTNCISFCDFLVHDPHPFFPQGCFAVKLTLSLHIYPNYLFFTHSLWGPGYGFDILAFKNGSSQTLATFPLTFLLSLFKLWKVLLLERFYNWCLLSCFLKNLMVQYDLFESISDTSWCMRGSNPINYCFNVIVQKTCIEGSFSLPLMFWTSCFIEPATV